MELALRFTHAAAQVLWVGALVALVAFAIERLLARTAATRHAVHLFGLILTALVLPVALFLAPVKVNQPAARPAHPSREMSVAPAPPISQPAITIDAPQPASQERDPKNLIGAGTGSSSPPASPSPDPGAGWQNLAPWIAGSYLAGLLAMVARMACGFAGSARMRRRGDPVHAPVWSEALRTMSDQIGVHIRPALKWSREVAAPVVIGFVKPAILLPMALASRLSSAQVEAVLAHELAHLRRRDPWALAVQRVVETVLFFHPAIWWMSHRMEAAREEACDDLVLAAGCDPADYAEALVICSEFRLERNGLSSKLAPHLAATGKGGAHLRRRVLRLIGNGDDGAVRLGRTGWVLGLLLVGGVVMAAESASRSEKPAFETDRDRNARLVAALQRPGAMINQTYVGSYGERRLKLSVFNAPKDTLPYLGQLHGIEELSFEACDLRTSAFNAVGKLSSLQKLSTCNCQFLPAQMTAISNLTHLEHLELMFTVPEETSEARTEALGDLTPDEVVRRDALRKAGNGDHVVQSALLTDRALAQLRHLTGLKTLALINTFVTPQSLEGFVELEELDANIIGLTADNAETLRRMKKLKSLRYFEADDAVAAVVAGLENLESLDMWSGAVTDAGAEHLVKLKKLRRLEIRGNRMTDSGLMKLAELPNLNYLDVNNASSLTAEGIARFRRARPGIVLCSSVSNAATADSKAVEGRSGIPVGEGGGRDAFAGAVAGSLVKAVQSHELPFVTDERVRQIRADTAELIRKYERDDLSAERRRAILAAIGNNGSGPMILNRYQPGDIGSLNQTYLEFPDLIKTLQWEVFMAIARAPLSEPEQRRMANQRSWMRGIVSGLADERHLDPKPVLANLEARFADPLCIPLDRPMTDSQFARFQNAITNRLPRAQATVKTTRAPRSITSYNPLPPIVHNFVIQSLWAQYQGERGDNSYPMFDADRVGGSGAANGYVTLHFMSNRLFQGDSRVLGTMELQFSIVDATTGVPISAPTDEHERMKFSNWIDKQDKGDFGLSRQTNGSLVAVRGSKLALLKVDNWVQADAIDDESLRATIQQQNKNLIQLASYYRANRDPRINYIGPYIGVLTKEGRLAVVHLEDFSGPDDITYRVRPRGNNPTK